MRTMRSITRSERRSAKAFDRLAKRDALVRRAASKLAGAAIAEAMSDKASARGDEEKAGVFARRANQLTSRALVDNNLANRRSGLPFARDRQHTGSGKHGKTTNADRGYNPHDKKRDLVPAGPFSRGLVKATGVAVVAGAAAGATYGIGRMTDREPAVNETDRIAVATLGQKEENKRLQLEADFAAGRIEIEDPYFDQP